MSSSEPQVYAPAPSWETMGQVVSMKEERKPHAGWPNAGWVLSRAKKLNLPHSLVNSLQDAEQVAASLSGMGKGVHPFFDAPRVIKTYSEVKEELEKLGVANKHDFNKQKMNYAAERKVAESDFESVEHTLKETYDTEVEEAKTVFEEAQKKATKAYETAVEEAKSEFEIAEKKAKKAYDCVEYLYLIDIEAIKSLLTLHWLPVGRPELDICDQVEILKTLEKEEETA